MLLKTKGFRLLISRPKSIQVKFIKPKINEVLTMKRTSVVLLIVFLIIGGHICGCSDDKSEVESKAKDAVKSLENKVIGEVKKIEQDYRVLEAEKDYKKALEAESKLQPEAINEADGKVDLGGGVTSPLD